MDYKIKITYAQQGNILIAYGSCAHFSLDCGSENGRTYVDVTAKETVRLIQCELSFDYRFEKEDRIFCNGYQSWTKSTERRVSDVQRGLAGLGAHAPIKRYASVTGDYSFVRYDKLAGQFHGFTYGYVRRGDRVDLFGSLGEREGWTQLVFSPYRDRIKLARDVEGKSLSAGETYRAFDFCYESGGYEEVFDGYFRRMGISEPGIDRICGYTSWYNYFGKISQDILLRDLQGLSESGIEADLFQIDDGYQRKVGDWLAVKEDKFPDGMAAMAEKIHEKGYLAGLWLAPTVCAKDSTIAQEHPQWLVYDPETGRPVLAAVAWGGAYALDLLNPEVRGYLRGVFDTIFEIWGFDLVKLDFLYAACLIPRANKTRGQLMCEAVDFLRDCCKDHYILGCGVPLGACFGKFDLCRIGCDVDLRYRDAWYKKHTNQEIVSTPNAINNAIMRRHLHKRAFVNDPDVFFVRNDNLRFTPTQKESLAAIAAMTGGVRLISDNAGAFTDDQKALLAKTFQSPCAKILRAEYVAKDLMEITYRKEEGTGIMRLDLRTGICEYAKFENDKR